MRAAPLSRWVSSDFEDWGFNVLACHARAMLEGYLYFTYLVQPTNDTLDESRARISLLQLNDCCSRLKLCSGDAESVAFYSGEAEKLRDRLRSIPFFQQLDPTVQETCLAGKKAWFMDRDQLIELVGMDKKTFDTWWDLFSQHSHIHPVSFYRNEPNGRGSGLECDPDRRHLAIAMLISAVVLEATTEKMIELFPDVAWVRKGVHSKFSPGPKANRRNLVSVEPAADDTLSLGSKGRSNSFERMAAPLNSSARRPVEREWPAFVRRYMNALSGPARDRWESSPEHRDLTKKRSMEVIDNPWGTESSPAVVTREFAFLRDLWNSFYECVQSCQTLDQVRDLSATAMESQDLQSHSATVTFWTESYLNEVYIFQCRLLDFIKFIQRRYKKDADFTEFVLAVGDSLAEFVKEQLAPLITDRGAHVHNRRHRRADPELARLALLDLMIDVLGHEELSNSRNQSRRDATVWLAKQVAHFSDLTWHLFDEVCRGFSDGILLVNDRIIVPVHYKDNPRAPLDMQEQSEH